MNFKFIYTIPLLLLAGFILSFSNGPAGGDGGNGPRMQDRSGSPHAITQGPTCSACHNTGSFNPSVSIELLADGNPVELYVPEETYTLRYTINANAGSPSRYGVQSVILDSNDENTGTFGDAPTGTRVADISSRKYFEHSTGSSENTFEIEWTAPAEGTGAVTVFASGVAANGGGTNADDNGAAGSIILEEELNVSSLAGVNALPVHVNLSPNPVADRMTVNVTGEISGQLSMQLMDINGKVHLSNAVEIVNGKNIFSYDVNDLPAGTYLLQLTDGQKVRVEKLIKR